MRPFRGQLFNPVWNPLHAFQNEMNRLFNRWTDGSFWEGESAFPAFNVWEENDQVHVEAEVPGLDLKALEIYVTGGNTLTIKGERKFTAPEKSVWHRQERVQGRFVRTLTLPYPVDADKVDARLENGVLSLTLTKHESAKPRKIAVKAE
jgi:HSP20 family protein